MFGTKILGIPMKTVAKEGRSILRATKQENGKSIKDFASSQRSGLTKTYNKTPANK